MKTIILRVEVPDDNSLNPIELLGIVGGMKATEIHLPTDEEKDTKRSQLVLKHFFMQNAIIEYDEWLKSKIMVP